MSDGRKGVGVRLYVAGGQDVRREFDDTANSGKRMFGQIAAGSGQVAPGMRAINTAAGEVRQGVDGLVDGMGGFGRTLGSVGVAGLATAAVLGGLAVALAKTREAMDWADELGDTAAKLHVSAEGLQAYRFAAEDAGLEASSFEKSIESLASALGKAKTGMRGSKSVLEAFGLIGITKEEIDQVHSLEELLPMIADGLAGVGDAAARAAIADKLGVRELLPMLEQGAASMQTMTDKARALGLVVSNETVQSMGDMQRQVEVAAQVVDVNLKTAFMNLAPVLVSLSQLLAGLARQLNNFFEDFKEVGDRSTQALRDKQAALDARMQGVLAAQKTLDPGALEPAAKSLFDALKAKRDVVSIELALRPTMVAPKFDPNGAISPGGFPTTSSSGGRVRSAGNGKSGIPGLIPVQESELARAWDPATRRELRDAWKDDAADQLFGPTIKAANKPDMSVSFKPDLSDAMEGFKAIEDETHASFKRGFMTVLQGGDVWDLLAQRLEETAAEGLADTMMSLIKLISGGDATGGAGAASWLVKGASWLFGGGRMAGGGQAWPGTMASTGEYGDELAIFGKGGRVVTHDETVAMLRQAMKGGGEGGGSVNLGGVNMSIDARGAGPREVDELRGQMRRMQAELPAVIVQTVNDGLGRRTIG